MSLPIQDFTVQLTRCASLLAYAFKKDWFWMAMKPSKITTTDNKFISFILTVTLKKYSRKLVPPIFVWYYGSLLAPLPSMPFSALFGLSDFNKCRQYFILNCCLLFRYGRHWVGILCRKCHFRRLFLGSRNIVNDKCSTKTIIRLRTRIPQIVRKNLQTQSLRCTPGQCCSKSIDHAVKCCAHST